MEMTLILDSQSIRSISCCELQILCTACWLVQPFSRQFFDQMEPCQLALGDFFTGAVAAQEALPSANQPETHVCIYFALAASCTNCLLCMICMTCRKCFATQIGSSLWEVASPEYDLPAVAIAKPKKITVNNREEKVIFGAFI